ncbi:MAG: DUF4912 domain-containing protein [Candidatus Brocadiaceae bacterium]|nr:DUF4912 domain-containing protein [Candidatus Brocadiaceae bacterium]
MSRQDFPEPPHPSAEEDRDAIFAVPRSPRSLFVHWRLVGSGASGAALAAAADSQWVLRVVNLTDGSSRTIAVPPERRSLYVDVEPGEVYAVELALRGGRRWRTVCRTPRMAMPPAVPGEAVHPARPAWPRPRTGIPGLDLHSTLPHLGSSFQTASRRDDPGAERPR